MYLARPASTHSSSTMRKIVSLDGYGEQGARVAHNLHVPTGATGNEELWSRESAGVELFAEEKHSSLPEITIDIDE